MLLEGGEITLDGTAADPEQRARALDALGAGQAEITLLDDGTPPGFTLTYDVRRGAMISGKLPVELRLADLSAALGLAVGGVPSVSPEGSEAPVVATLRAIAPLLPELDEALVAFADDAISVRLVLRAPVAAEPVRDTLGQTLSDGVALEVVPGAAPALGTRRVNILSNGTDIFVSGHWLPELGFAPNRESCAAGLGVVPSIAFEEGRFALPARSGPVQAQLAALARACTGIAGLTLRLHGQTDSAPLPAINRQIARRRAEALRSALVERGVAAARIRTEATEGAEALTYAFE